MRLMTLRKLERMRIRRVQVSEIGTILEFLERTWKPGHIFTRHPELLRWQHGDNGSDEINFLVAEEEGDFRGILGYIPFRRFDPQLKENDLALALWVVVPSSPAGLGLRIFRELIRIENPSRVVVVGIRETALPLYRALGFHVGQLTHYFVSRSDDARDKAVKAPEALRQDQDGPLQLLDVTNSISDIRLDLVQSGKSGGIAKSATYLRNRYEDHPWYYYKFLAFGKSDHPKLIAVAREIDTETHSLWRLVDFIGNSATVPLSAAPLREFLCAGDASYLDLVCDGLSRESMMMNGFRVANEGSEVFLPTHLEPPNENPASINFAYLGLGKNSQRPRIHLADGDQDRPNVIIKA